MASALLATGNEPCWGEAKAYMRKNPISNPNPRPYPNLCPGDHDGYQEIRFRTTELEETPPAATMVVSEEESSFNRKRDGPHHRRDLPGFSTGGYVTFDTSTYSRRELRELKRRLISELDQVRRMIGRIQARDLSTSARSVGFSASGVYGGSREVNSPAAFQSVDPYANQPSDLVVNANKVSGSRRASLVSPREPKRLALAPAPDSEKLLSAMMKKKCAQILSKLMKHKKCIWFNSPVDVAGMGLHDYFQIVKTPMDLGTVKAKLNKGLYLSPEEFASDVRLTFKNALVYNPEGHEVHKLADQFLRHFEVLFGPASHKFKNQRASMEADSEAGAEVRPRFLTESALKHGILSSLPASPQPLPPNQETQQMPRLEAHQRFPSATRAPGLVKLPKPKAKEPNKRPMSLEEKQKLSEGLQSLPQEKMSHLLSIVKKRNPDVMQNGDEIELDIDSMDIETLWELDRFLSNFKKMMGKMRRQEAFAASSGSLPSGHAAVEAPPEPVPAVGGEMYPMLVDESEEVAAARKSKKGGDLIAEEDVDIGDELPGTNYPSVEIHKDAGYASSSSSSASESSSSSDSDSGSSSESKSESEGGGEDSPNSQRN